GDRIVLKLFPGGQKLYQVLGKLKLDHRPPLRIDVPPQFPEASLQTGPACVTLRQTGERRLHAEEIGSWVSPLFEPVGVDEPERNVVGVGDDGVKESLVIIHRSILLRWFRTTLSMTGKVFWDHRQRETPSTQRSPAGFTAIRGNRARTRLPFRSRA